MREQFNDRSDRNQYYNQQPQYSQSAQRQNPEWSESLRGDLQNQSRFQGNDERGEWQSGGSPYRSQSEQFGSGTGWLGDHLGAEYGRGSYSGRQEFNPTGQVAQYGQSAPYGNQAIHGGQYGQSQFGGQYGNHLVGQYGNQPYGTPLGSQYGNQYSGQQVGQYGRPYGLSTPYGQSQYGQSQYGNQLSSPFGPSYGLQGQPNEWERSYGRSVGNIANYGSDYANRALSGGYASNRYEGNPYGGNGMQSGSLQERDYTGYGQPSQFGTQSLGSWQNQLGPAGQTYRGRGPKNYIRSDERITEDLNERLFDDDSIDASNINVSVKEGIATLTGTVEHRGMKHRAEDLTGACSGVKDVDNQLRVQNSSELSASRSGTSSGSSQGSSSTTKSTKSESGSSSGSSH